MRIVNSYLVIFLYHLTVHNCLNLTHLLPFAHSYFVFHRAESGLNLHSVWWTAKSHINKHEGANLAYRQHIQNNPKPVFFGIVNFVKCRSLSRQFFFDFNILSILTYFSQNGRICTFWTTQIPKDSFISSCISKF